MIIFTLIFFAIVIAVGVAAVVGFSIYLKRRNKSLDAINQKQFNEPPPNRSLFAPTNEEVRLIERDEQSKRQLERAETERKVAGERTEKVREFERIWRNKPTKQNTIELLHLASQSESTEIFSQTAENVLQILHYEQAGGLSKKDLADLVDSHLRILPQQERFSGAIFWIKREIENLRRTSEERSSDF